MPSEITIKVNAEFLDADRFQLFYAFNDDLKFIESRSINNRIIGKKGGQDIIFKIPLQNKMLKSIRLDISSANYNQRPISINSINIYNGSSQLVFKDVFSYFEMNKFLSFEKGKFKTVLLNDKYDPYLLLKKESTILEKLSLKEYRFTLLKTLLYSLIISIIFWVLSLFLVQKGKMSHTTVLNLLFVLIIFVPLGLRIFEIKETAQQLENREASVASEFEFSKEYFRGFENYYNDNFPFRNTLIKQSTAIKTNLFKSSPFPQKVKFGKDKFLFSNIEEAYKSYTKSNLLSDSQLSGVITKFVNRNTELNAKNKEYFLGYFPNKHKIYSEYLPNSMQNQIKDTLSLADQIKTALSRTSLNFFDPTDELLNHKGDNLLYHKLDTHWNNYGAFIAYKEFFKYNNKTLNIQPYSIDNFNIIYRDRTWGDLTRLIGTDTISGYLETIPLFQFKNQSQSFKKVDVKGFPTGTIRTLNIRSGNNKKVLFFGDSFSIYIVQFFSLHFDEVIYIRGIYNQELIDRIDPDIVIELMVERFIYKQL